MDTTFRINESARSTGEEYELVLDGDSLRKAGDGTVGLVLVARNKRSGKLHAAKILYEGSLSMGTVSIDIAHVDDIIDECKRRSKEMNARRLDGIRAVLSKSHANLGALILELEALDLSETERRHLLDAILKRARSAAVEQFQLEMNLSSLLRAKLTALVGEARARQLYTRVIEPLGGTERFHQSPAFKHLGRQFKELGVRLSTYAEVLPLYEISLKDLLEYGPTVEMAKMTSLDGSANLRRYAIHRQALLSVFGVRGLPDNLRVLADIVEDRSDFESALQILDEASQNALRAAIYDRVGYRLLSSLTFDERIKAVGPILHSLTQGLLALHLAGICHLDLKPANIFIRLNGRDIEVVIGDLGFLGAAAVLAATTMSSTYDMLPLGTRPFRSPEQKDYAEPSYARVEVSDTEDRVIKLTIDDPKVRDSIMEKGDFVVFSKDSARRKFTIMNIDRGKPNESVRMLLDYPQECTVSPDKSTQIVLYKKQGYRTDIFDVGAILFDLITSGRNPEQFYESIRAFEFAEDGSVGEVEDVMVLYRQVSNFQSSRPELTPLFDPFKHYDTGTYAPESIVSFILKCMLYKAKGTFYNPDGDPEHAGKPHEAMERAQAELNELFKSYPPTITDNPLIVLRAATMDGAGSTRLSTRLAELRQAPAPIRLAHGIWYLQALGELVRNSVNDTDRYFVSLLPDNILVRPKGPGSLDQELSVVNPVFKSEPEYLSALRDDAVHKRLIRDLSNPFVPQYMGTLRRNISLTRLTPPEGHANDAESAPSLFKFSFLDVSPMGGSMKVGDWVVAKEHLFAVKQVKEDIIELAPHDPTDVATLTTLTNEELNSSCTYHQQLDRMRYYFSMLSAYVYQLFFVDTEYSKSRIDKPLIMTIGELTIGSNPLRPIQSLIDIKDAPAVKSDLSSILSALVHLYVRLSFAEHPKAYPSAQLGTDDARLKAVLDAANSRYKRPDILSIKQAIELYLGLQSGYLDRFRHAPDIEQAMSKNNARGLTSIKSVDDVLKSVLRINLT